MEKIAETPEIQFGKLRQLLMGIWVEARLRSFWFLYWVLTDGMEAFGAHTAGVLRLTLQEGPVSEVYQKSTNGHCTFIESILIFILIFFFVCGFGSPLTSTASARVWGVSCDHTLIGPCCQEREMPKMRLPHHMRRRRPVR